MPKLQSYTITQGTSRAGARSMLKAIGFTDEDLAKPIIGVANTWIETMPCNFNLRELAAHVKAGIRAAGGTPMEFNTIAISDGVTMGTEGMKASLVSREVIADSIELLVRGHMFDGIVALVACDKTIPGAAMALLRAQRARRSCSTAAPSCPANTRAGRSAFRMSLKPSAPTPPGKISDDELLEIENRACPGAGACGGQFTANTMATVMELIGLSPMGTASVPQVDKRKEKIAYRCGQIIMDAVRNNLRPRDICTRKAFENAIAGVAAHRRVHQRRAAPARHGARSRSAALHRRFRNRQRAHARCWPISNPAADSWPRMWIRPAAFRLIAQRLLEGKFVDGSALTITGRTFRRRSRGGQRDARAGSDPSAEQPAQAARRPRDSARHPGAGWLRDQAVRPRQETAPGTGARVRMRRRRAHGRAWRAASSRAMW